MAKLKLTDGLVEGIEPGAKDVYVWDEALARFGVRVTKAGGRIYLVQYRAKAAPGEKSQTRRIPIGQHDGDLWNATKARAAARKLLALVDTGTDPFANRVAEREAARAAAEAAQAAKAAAEVEAIKLEQETFKAQAEVYITEKLAKRRSATEAARLLRHGPVVAWGARHVAAIERTDVVKLLRSIEARSPAVARATFAELRTFFGWLIEGGLLQASPLNGVRPPKRPAARDRVLSDEELRLIWRGAEVLGYPFGHAIKLLVLTAQRRAEVSGMAASELDLEACTWRIPAERSKNGQAHEVDLTPEAVKIVRAVMELRGKGDLLFPARGDEGGLKGWSATKRRLDAIIEDLRRQDAEKSGEDPPEQPLPEWRIHDLRRTAATGMAGLQFAPHIVERVLNHASTTNAGLVGVYQRYTFRPERKAALEAWGRQVAAILEARPMPSNVRVLRA